MHRLLVAIALAAAACGGAKKQASIPLPPDPKTDADAKDADAKDAAKPDRDGDHDHDKPVAPAPPPGPIDTALASPKVTVKLVSPGKGKRTALKVVTKAGATQHVELAMDFAGKETAPADLGGVQEDVAPTLVLDTQAEVKAVDKDGKTDYVLTVNGVDARDVTGQKKPTADFKAAVVGLIGLTIAGSIDANGAASDLKLNMAKPAAKSEAAIELLKLTFPAWPSFPTEPVGVGAKWQATAKVKFAGQLEVTQTTDYELTAHKDASWTIKGTTKISGTDQEIQGMTATKIGGTGTIEIAMVDGALYPTVKQQLATEFTMSGPAPDPADPNKQRAITIQFGLKQGSAITPK